MFVGIGADGHLLSVFPGSAAFDSPKWALGSRPTHIEPHVARVTLDPATVRVAHRVLAVVLGAAKAISSDGCSVSRPTRRDCRPSSRSARGRPGSRRGRGGPATLVTTAAAERLTIRRATTDDTGRIADVWLSSWRATFDFPPAHPDEDVRRWLREELVPEHETWVATDPDAEDRVIALMALSDTAVEQLYVAPDWIVAPAAGSWSSQRNGDRPPGAVLLRRQLVCPAVLRTEWVRAGRLR